MTEARLLCVGDMHLGRRPSRLPAEAPRDVDPRAAWATVVETALEHDVDAVLLAGDVVESRNGFMEAYGALLKGVQRLRQHGVDVVAVAGNHDVEVLPRLADELEHFHLLGRGGRWDTFVVRRDGEPVARVLGWSFPRQRVESSPLDSLTEAQRAHQFDDGASDELRTVGLLHCDLDANGGGYAPVGRAALANLGLSAWLLGHIHAPSLGGTGRPLGYLGSLVALDPGEPGPRGPWLAQSQPGTWQLEHLELSPVRWESVRVDVGSCPDLEAVKSALWNSARELHERIGRGAARVVGLRPRLVGETHLAPHDLRLVLEEARDLAEERRGDTLYFFDKGQDDTLPALDLEALGRGRDPASLLARRLLTLEQGGEACRALLEGGRARLARVAAHRNLQSLEAPRLDDEEVRSLLIRTARRALHELLAQKSPLEPLSAAAAPQAEVSA